MGVLIYKKNSLKFASDSAHRLLEGSCTTERSDIEHIEDLIHRNLALRRALDLPVAVGCRHLVDGKESNGDEISFGNSCNDIAVSASNNRVDAAGSSAQGNRARSASPDFVTERRKDIVTASEGQLQRAPTANQIEYVDTSGSAKPLGVNTFVLGLNDGPHCICMLQDQTAYRELEKANIGKQYLKTFFAMTTHEFRNPLQGIMGIFENLVDTLESTDAVAECKMGVATSKLMLRLVNDILDLSQMESDKFRLINGLTDIPQAVSECLELMQYKYRAKGVQLVYTQPSPLPMITCDKNRYVQILLNILGNAIKFTDNGSVTVTIEYISDSHKLLTSVSDTGVGIKEEDQTKLFKAFGKLEDTQMMNPQGIGLGLHVCKKLVEAMGGDISIHSRYLNGTTITFTICDQKEAEAVAPMETTDIVITHKRRETSSVSIPPALAPANAPAEEAARVLVVDDEVVCASAVQSHLKHCGYASDVVFASDFDASGRRIQE